MRIAVNGFGRVGRIAARLAVERPDRFKLVQINASKSAVDVARALAYDSVHGRFSGVEVIDDDLYVRGGRVVLTQSRSPAESEWDGAVVLETTGRDYDMRPHLESAAAVLISAPADVPMFVFGVNHETYAGESIVSCASCTTTALAPILQSLHRRSGIVEGFVTTVHAVTQSQGLLDGSKRSALLNVIPASTGAACAIGRILPELEGRLRATALRVPTANVSVLDVTCRVAGKFSELDVEYAEPGLVSQDFVGDTRSCIVASTSTLGDLVHIRAWYDNEAGYAMRMLDLAEYIRSRAPHVNASRNEHQFEHP